MKLSEAIREGSKGVTQCKFSLIATNCERCALGAALKAVDPKIETFDDLFHGSTNIGLAVLEREFSDTLYKRVLHPVYGTASFIRHIIFDLNDGESWTFEEIADWLENEGL